MDINKILADFQFSDNKVINFYIKNNPATIDNKKIQVGYDMDYEVIGCEELEDRYVGELNLVTNLIGGIQDEDEELFRINLVMNGKFTGDKTNLSIEQFQEMLEVNGTATLSQISRSYLNSVSSLSGMIPIKLPMVNIHKMKEHRNQNNSNSDE